MTTGESISMALVGHTIREGVTEDIWPEDFQPSEVFALVHWQFLLTMVSMLEHHLLVTLEGLF